MGGARCLAAPFPGTAPAPRPALRQGQLHDETGAPVRFVTVLLEPARGAGTPLAATSGGNGAYQIALFTPGRYDLTATLGTQGVWQMGVHDRGERRRRTWCCSRPSVSRVGARPRRHPLLGW
jgi:hypothetical protein